MMKKFQKKKNKISYIVARHGRNTSMLKVSQKKNIARRTVRMPKNKLKLVSSLVLLATRKI
jgi:hypothetical protein